MEQEVGVTGTDVVAGLPFPYFFFFSLRIMLIYEVGRKGINVLFHISL